MNIGKMKLRVETRILLIAHSSSCATIHGALAVQEFACSLCFIICGYVYANLRMRLMAIYPPECPLYC